MKSIDLRIALFAAFVVTAGSVLPARAADDYVPGPDSLVHAGVPKGQVFSFSFNQSAIFPGAVYTCSVYVPAQYTPDHPACLYVSPDGVIWKAPVVFDNLIAKYEMPVTIGVFVSSGLFGNGPAGRLGRRNRTHEYSAMNDDYARFLIEELLPAVESRKTSDGRAIHISHDGNDRAIAGSSAGGICAFTAAWERPDSFSRVFSACGGFGLYGGESYYGLIRVFEPKRLRVFLQDGSQDGGVFAGDWWMANQTMERALIFSGYEVNHAWGDGGHTGKHATAIFPDVMRWLWKDWPQPIKTGANKNQLFGTLLIPGQGWTLVGKGYGRNGGLAVNSRGEVFVSDAGTGEIHRIGLDGNDRVFLSSGDKACRLSFGSDGRLYAISPQAPQLTSYASDGSPTRIAAGVASDSIAVAHNGDIYLTDSAGCAGGASSNLWLIKPDGSRRAVGRVGMADASGIALSPDQTLLFVSDRRAHWIYRYAVQPDGSLRNGQRYIRLHMADNDDSGGAPVIRVDRSGRLYVATALGIQICGEADLVSGIITAPGGGAADICFGGPNFSALFARCGDKVFRREFNVRGTDGWSVPAPPLLPPNSPKL